MKKTVPIWLSIIMLLLSIGSTFVQCYQITQILSADEIKLSLISNLILFVGSLFALMYCLVGYKKNSAVYYKYFSLLYLVFVYAGTCLSSMEGFGHYTMTGMIAIGAASVMFFAKDLGKIKSYIFAGVLLGMALIDTIAAISTKMMVNHDFACITYLVLAIIYCIMVYGKYVDKDSRGTK